MRSEQRSRERLAQELYEVAICRGPFRLRSGEFTTEYFDKYLFEADPRLLSRVCEELRVFIPDNAEMIAGLELGGMPIATVLSQITRLPLRFVRKHAKEYGTAKLFEGGPIRGKRLIIVEDVVTSGAAVIHAVKALRGEGAIVQDVLCVLEHECGGPATLKQFGLRLHRLFSMDELRHFAKVRELFREEESSGSEGDAPSRGHKRRASM
jgi:orotate phosphoribosyltransferase